MAARERTAVLVLRAWIRDGEGLRARIIVSDDVLSGSETTMLAGSQHSLAASGVDEICLMVRGWLEPLAREAGEALPPR